jgi:putative methyltransferase (TIGR04325 family)
MSRPPGGLRMTASSVRAALRNTVKTAVRRHAPVFADYAEALPHCRPGGYDDRAIAAVVRAKTGRLANDPDASDNLLPPAGRAGLALLSALAQLVRGKDRPIRVLDVGGACGAHYFAARHLAPAARFDWCVVETGAMISAGRSLADDGLKFAADIADGVCMLGGAADLLHSSSTLQYLPRPETGLSGMLAVRAPVLALTRLSLTDGDSFTVVQKSRLSQNGPGPMPPGFQDASVSYPLTILNRARVEEALRSNDYEIVARYRDESSDHITPRGMIRGSSYVCLRKCVTPA